MGMRPSPRGGSPVTIASTGTVDIGPSWTDGGTGSVVTAVAVAAATVRGFVVPVAGRVDLAIGVLLAGCFTSLTYLPEPYPPEDLGGARSPRLAGSDPAARREMATTCAATGFVADSSPWQRRMGSVEMTGDGGSHDVG